MLPRRAKTGHIVGPYSDLDRSVTIAKSDPISQAAEISRAATVDVWNPRRGERSCRSR